jgi:hypothetical protein
MTQETTVRLVRQLIPSVAGRVRRSRTADGRLHSVVTAYYDWSEIDAAWREANIFPVISELALRATLGILARTVERE